MFKFKKSIVIAALGSLAFAVLYGGQFPYFILYTFLLTLLICFLWTWLTVRKVRISQYTENKTCYVGEEIEISTEVFNKSIIPIPYMEVENNLVRRITGEAPKARVLFIMPFGRKIIKDKAVCRYRGVYVLGPVNISISDVFGFFTWNIQIKCSGELWVYPRIIKLHKFNVKPARAFGTAATKKKSSEDHSSISEIRKYYPGDSFKKIHWKVSAKKGDLHVKNFDMSGSAEANVFLNMYQGDYNHVYRLEIEEKAVECAAALTFYSLARNINTSLYINSSQMFYEKGRDLKGFKKFIERFIKIKSDGGISLNQALDFRSNLLFPGSSIMLVTPALGRDLADKIVRLKETGFDVTIIYINVEDLDEEYSRIFSSCGVKLYKVGIKDDVKASLEG